MLKLDTQKRVPVLKWSDADTLFMARLIGPDAATKRRMPFNASVVRMYAKKYGDLHLSRKVRGELHKADALRQERKRIEVRTDRLLLPDLNYHEHPPHTSTGFAHQRACLQMMDQLQTQHHVNGWLLADDVGVGKTWQAIMWSRFIVKSRRTLVITKNIAKGQWLAEIERWDPENASRALVVEGSRVQQEKVIANRVARWCVAHWESLPFHGALYRRQRWDAIILDEAHMIANRDTQRTQVVHGMSADARMALTAHPWTNDVGELWSILAFLYPDVYTSYWRFFHQYVRASPKEFGGFDIEGVKRAKLLQWEMSPFLVRRMRTEVRESLPAITRTERTVTMPRSGVLEYERLKKDMFAELRAHKGEVTLAILNDFVRLTRLRQYIVDPGLVGARAKPWKYEAILEIIDSANVPVVVFCEYREALVRFDAWLHTHWKKHCRVGHIRGRMKRQQVRRVQTDFLRGKYDVVCVSAKAGDTALNFGKYGVCVHLDLPWNTRGLEQREGRVDRPEEGTGLSVPTTSYFVTVAGTYEDRLKRRLNDRHAQFHSVFPTRELEDLFQ